MIRALFFAALVLFAGVAEAKQRASVEADKAAIIAHGTRWSSLYETNRIDEMRVLYEPDAWLMTQGAPAANGVDAILAYLKRNKASGNKVSFSFLPELITIDGDRAYLISKYWMAIEPLGKPVVNARGRSFLVFKRCGKEWCIWRDMDNMSPDVTDADQPR